MPGTPPFGPAALSRVLVQTLPARRPLELLVLAVVALAIALALAAQPARAQAPATCPSAARPLGAVASAAVEAAIGCLVNAERTARGLVAVRPSSALDLAAQRHAVDMIGRRYFAHVSPTGGTLDMRANRAGYLTAPCWALGEDLGWAKPESSNAEAVVAAWMASPTHRAVILDPEFREIGLGIVPRAPTPDGAGATFVLELGAMTPCAEPRTALRAKPRVRVRAG
jgi:uncharacterized protein YkwD